MRVHDLAVVCPTVTLSDLTADAVRLVRGSKLPGLGVVGHDASPYAVLAAMQVTGAVTLAGLPSAVVTP